MRRRSAASLRQLIASGCLALVVTGCTNDVMDAFCTPEAPDITLDSDCPFGNGRGPQVQESACPPVEGEATGAADFTDVFAILIDKSRGNCAAGGCHGEEATAALQIYLPSGDPARFYETLTATKGSVGRPYVNPDSPEQSWIVCNVRGDPGGGFPMPKPSGFPDLADAEVVRNWVLLGAQGPPQ